MKNENVDDCIAVENINLWAHVGVFDFERSFGQKFTLSFFIFVDDFTKAARTDDINDTYDYSKGVTIIQKLSRETVCFTVERFSEIILDNLEQVYGKLPIKIKLSKCNPPIKYFKGSISIVRSRNIF